MERETITLYAGPEDGTRLEIPRGATHIRLPLSDPTRRPPHIAIYQRCPMLTLQHEGEPVFRHIPDPHSEDMKA